MIRMGSQGLSVEPRLNHQGPASQKCQGESLLSASGFDIEKRVRITGLHTIKSSRAKQRILPHLARNPRPSPLLSFSPSCQVRVDPFRRDLTHIVMILILILTLSNVRRMLISNLAEPVIRQDVPVVLQRRIGTV